MNIDSFHRGLGAEMHNMLLLKDTALNALPSMDQLPQKDKLLNDIPNAVETHLTLLLKLPRGRVIDNDFARVALAVQYPEITRERYDMKRLFTFKADVMAYPTRVFSGAGVSTDVSNTVHVKMRSLQLQLGALFDNGYFETPPRLDKLLEFMVTPTPVHSVQVRGVNVKLHFDELKHVYFASFPIYSVAEEWVAKMKAFLKMQKELELFALVDVRYMNPQTCNSHTIGRDILFNRENIIGAPQKLVKLFLSGVGITTDNLKEPSTAQTVGYPNLVSLSLSSNVIKDEGLDVVLAHIASKIPKLAVLQLERTHITMGCPHTAQPDSAICTRLIQFIMNVPLRELYIGFNEIGSDSHINNEFFNVLFWFLFTQNKSLQILDMTCARVSIDTLFSIAAQALSAYYTGNIYDAYTGATISPITVQQAVSVLQRMYLGNENLSQGGDVNANLRRKLNHDLTVSQRRMYEIYDKYYRELRSMQTGFEAKQSTNRGVGKKNLIGLKNVYSRFQPKQDTHGIHEFLIALNAIDKGNLPPKIILLPTSSNPAKFITGGDSSAMFARWFDGSGGTPMVFHDPVAGEMFVKATFITNQENFNNQTPKDKDFNTENRFYSQKYTVAPESAISSKRIKLDASADAPTGASDFGGSLLNMLAQIDNNDQAQDDGIAHLQMFSAESIFEDNGAITLGKNNNAPIVESYSTTQIGGLGETGGFANLSVARYDAVNASNNNNNNNNINLQLFSAQNLFDGNGNIIFGTTTAVQFDESNNNNATQTGGLEGMGGFSNLYDESLQGGQNQLSYNLPVAPYDPFNFNTNNNDDINIMFYDPTQQ